MMIADYDLVTDEGKFFGCSNLVKIGQNRTQNEVFCHFLKFGSLVFFEIA